MSIRIKGSGSAKHQTMAGGFPGLFCEVPEAVQREEAEVDISQHGLHTLVALHHHHPHYTVAPPLVTNSSINQMIDLVTSSSIKQIIALVTSSSINQIIALVTNSSINQIIALVTSSSINQILLFTSSPINQILLIA